MGGGQQCHPVKVHNFVNRIVLGEKHDRVNRMLDLPSFVLKERHRIIFHDPDNETKIWNYLMVQGKIPSEGN